MKYFVLDSDGDNPLSGYGFRGFTRGEGDLLKILNDLDGITDPEDWREYSPYTLFEYKPSLDSISRDELRCLIKQLEENPMLIPNNTNLPSVGDVTAAMDLIAQKYEPLKKYTLSSKNGLILGSFDSMEELMDDVEDKIRKGSREEYLVLQSVKTVRAKTPEIETIEVK